MKTKTNIKTKIIPSLLLIIILLGFTTVNGQGTIVAEKNLDQSIKKWHKIELFLAGPNLTEEAATYRNYRLDVTFVSPSNKIYKVPGFFDADGDPANSGASSGNVWKARFCAGEAGNWTYSVSFVSGVDVAASLTGGAGGTSPDGQQGNFMVGSQDKTGKDFRAKGKLQYVGEHYLRFDDGDNFIKCGANSPEIFMSDKDFDGTTSVSNSIGNVDHNAQTSSWNTGDPTWKNGLGKGIIGVVNYLSSKGVNAHYFLSMNIEGDGKRTFPYIDANSPYVFDVSKLGQWELVFSQFDAKGLMIHFQTTETENASYFEGLEGGVATTQFSIARKIYYRELIARFGHHLAITWNVGEENNAPSGTKPVNTVSQRKLFAERLRDLTYYKDNIVIHNGGSGQNNALNLYPSLLSDVNYTGTSLQLPFGNTSTHDNIKYWWSESEKAAQKWVISFDEPYADGSTKDLVLLRNETIWGTLLAGGQMEWYHGAGGDLKIDLDYSSLEPQWEAIGIAANFMNSYLSKDIHKMSPDDNLIQNGTSINNYVLAETGETYLIYLKNGGEPIVNLSAKSGQVFNVQWFDPRNGGNLINANDVTAGTSFTSLGNPPNNASSDWVVLVKNKNSLGIDLDLANDLISNEIMVYPIPFKNTFNIQTTTENPITSIALFDITGKTQNIVLENSARGVSCSIENIVKGTYLLKIITKNKTLTKTIIKE
jgi:hypothetical protein